MSRETRSIAIKCRDQSGKLRRTYESCRGTYELRRADLLQKLHPIPIHHCVTRERCAVRGIHREGKTAGIAAIGRGSCSGSRRGK